MSNIKHNYRKFIYSSCAIILFSAVGTNAEISLPAPDNAALLYYQAMLLRPELNDDAFSSFHSVLSGGDPNEIVRLYLNLSRQAINLAEAATKILGCSWGIMRNQGNDLLVEWRELVYLFEVDARILTVDAQYRSALERCLSIRRFARHIDDEGVLGYLVSMAIDSRSLSCLNYILGLMPPDRDTLIWLQSQISNVQGALPLYGRAFEVSSDDDLQWFSEDPNTIERWRQNNSERIEDESTRQEILNLTDEEVLELVKESNNRFLSSVNRIVASNMSYQQKHLELKKLEEELKSDPIVDPFYYPWISFPGNIAQQYNIYVRTIAKFNATRAAIEVYLVKAETGQLPQVLPAHLPKDPFSGQDFGYEATAQDFTLRCREKENGQEEVWEYEFPVAQ